MMILCILFQEKFKVETKVETWIQKYDQDMGERQVRNFNLVALSEIFMLSPNLEMAREKWLTKMSVPTRQESFSSRST